MKKPLTSQQGKFLLFFEKQIVREIISWIVLFIFVSGFYILFQYPAPAPIDTVDVLRTSLMYTLWLMLPVYFNLKILVDKILENEKTESKLSLIHISEPTRPY